jgi:phosphoenolpyruvate-protein phosphotransferase
VPQGAILVAEMLRPADAALIDPARIAGLATEEGGTAGHTAIMLRALGVPAVLGVPGLLTAAKTGTMAVLDGAAGRIVLNPKPPALAEAKRGLAAYAKERQRLARLRRLPAITTDHEPVELQGNLELLVELPLVAQSGATGIGLFRTEFLFMNRETLPDEAAQAETYRTVIEAMDGDCVTIRVLDWGGEKDIDALVARGLVPDTLDHNPALGVRGLRLLLRQPDLFETQLAAILRASKAGPVRVLLPMVTNVGEVRQARDIYDRVARRLRRRGEKLPEQLPELGIMIETPGAALAADALALEADFFAIGTNDLAMYSLAVDRAAIDVADLYDPLHPAVLRLIQFATEAALRLRMPVSVCGEMAANPMLTPLLLGLGLRSFSMNASAVPRVKQAVRAVSIDDCARFARRVMEQSDPERIQDLVARFSA